MATDKQIAANRVRSPLMAASATLALKPGVWFRRGRLLIEELRRERDRTP
jgi:hypothetical protein